MEVSWFCGIIEQHGDGTRARANIDNRTGLVSQFWAATHPKFAHLEASTNNNCACPLTNQSRNPMSVSLNRRSTQVITPTPNFQQPAAIYVRKCTLSPLSVPSFISNR